MTALAGGLRKLWDSLFAVTFALVGFQLPALMAIYRQRLDQKLMDHEGALATLRASPTPDASSIARFEAEIPAIRRAVEELAGTGLARLRAFAEHFDPAIIRRILANFEPSLPLTAEAALYGALTALLGLVVAALLAAPFRALFRPRRRLENF